MAITEPFPDLLLRRPVPSAVVLPPLRGGLLSMYRRSRHALAKRSSLMQAWIGGLKVGPNTSRKIIADVSQVFAVALDDGIIVRNPLSARSVQKPKAVKTEAIPWTAAEVEAVAEGLPAHLAALPYLGSACGLRQDELFATQLSDVDFLRKTARIEAQVKYRAGHLFSPR